MILSNHFLHRDKEKEKLMELQKIKAKEENIF